MFFKPGRYNICTLNSEMKARWAVGGVKWGQKHGTRRSQVVCDQFKVGKIVLHKNVKMPNCDESCQQLMVKSGVARLRVSQLARKECKGLPMVARFLLHDPSDMSIGGVGGKRKFSIWHGMLEGHRRCQEAFCSLECLLCRGGPLQRHGPPLRRSVKGRNTCAQLGRKRL
jgi:hypothetical protein